MNPPKILPLALVLGLAGACSSVSPTAAMGGGDVALDDGDEHDSEADTEGEMEQEETDELPGLEPDMGADEAICDPWAQDCPPGKKCSYQNVDGEYITRCVPLSDEPAAVGDPCTVIGAKLSGADDCELGSICSFVGDENTGVCLELCKGSLADPGCAEQGSFCRACEDCPSVCTKQCDPLSEDCFEGLLCLPFDQVFGCWESLNGGKGADVGEECEYANQCGPGLGCVAPENYPGCEGVGCCTPYCDLQLDDGCPNSLTCVPYFDGNEVPVEYANLGLCLGY